MKPGDLVKVNDMWQSSSNPPTIGIITKIGSDSKIHVLLANGKVTWRIMYELQVINETR